MIQEFTENNLIKFEAEWFANMYPHLRYGQLMCNVMTLPKELEDKIFYANTSVARMIIWEYFGQ